MAKLIVLLFFMLHEERREVETPEVFGWRPCGTVDAL